MTDKEIDYKILQRENENLLKANKDLVREIEKIQSDFIGDVKEFADRLKIAFHFYIVKNEDTGEEINTDDFIDELIKEYEK